MKASLKNVFVGLCSAAFLLLFLSNPVQAQGILGHSADLAGNIGFSNLTGVDNNKHINFGGSFGFNPSSRATILAEYSYLPMGSVSASSGGTSASVNGDYQQFGAAGHFNLGSAKTVVPYALVAFGYARCTAGLTVSVSGSGSASGSGSLNGDYIGFGGGASIFFGKGFGLRPEFRYERQDFYVSGQSLSQNVALGTTSLFYQFGGKGKKKAK